MPVPYYTVNLVLIVLIIGCLGWLFLSYYHQDRMDKELWKPPESIQCLIPNITTNKAKNDCTRYVNIDGWSISHVVFFFLLGLVVPSHYIAVLLLSIIFEYGEYLVAWRARWVLDPLVNLLGYFLGSLLSARFLSSLNGTGVADVLQRKQTTWVLIPVTIAVVIVSIFLINKKSKKRRL